MDQVRLVLPPAAKVPLAAERLVQVWGLAADQLRAAGPVFVRVQVTDSGLNGPPTWPFGANAGMDTCKYSGVPAKALIRAVPTGVPQPVHRSYPATAENLLVLVLLKLLPVVVS